MWWNKYVGLPFVAHGRDRNGCDCYGLVRLALMENFGITAPLYLGYDDPNLKMHTANYIDTVKTEWFQVPTEKPGDILLLRVAGVPCHVGLVIVPGQMLHVMEGIEASIESYNAPGWRRRIEGFYRHVELA